MERSNKMERFDLPKYPNISTYVTNDTYRKFRYLAFMKNTSMAKLMLALVQAATKEITIADVDKAQGITDESKTDT